jgi:archaeal flagellar protein FlaI
MLTKERIDIENEILDKLTGKSYLLLDATQKQDAIFQVFLKVFNSASCQKIVRKTEGLDAEKFFKEFLSYGIIEQFIANHDVEDIMINYLSPIFVHKTKEGLLRTDQRFSSKEELYLFIKKLVFFSGRREIKKINNVELLDGKGRANIIYSPFGPQITITRAKEHPLSIIEMVKSGALNAELAGQFWLYVEGLGIKPANIIISGGPGAGKTTLLNALFNFIPPTDRMIVIEDTLELNTDLIENCSRLESDDEVTLADLVKNSLRMRPDRIIVGEVRGREAQDLMTAMNIGKYCMGTLHASTTRETIIRMTSEPMNVPDQLLNLVDVFVIMHRVNSSNKIRRMVGELAETANMSGDKVLLSSLWSYDYSANRFKESAVSSVYRDRIAEISGRTSKEIMAEMANRIRFIKLLVEKNITGYAEVTKICCEYIENPQAAFEGLKGRWPIA